MLLKKNIELNGKFTVCNTADQVVEFLSLMADGSKTAEQARKAVGKAKDGVNHCALGHWYFTFGRQHPGFQVGEHKFVINEIEVHGALLWGSVRRGKSKTQFRLQLLKDPVETLPKRPAEERI